MVHLRAMVGVDFEVFVKLEGSAKAAKIPLAANAKYPKGRAG